LNSSSSDERYEHISDEERSKGHTKCDEASSWMYEMLDKQGSLTACDDPAFSVSQVNAMIKEVSYVVNPIMNKPKPKPKTEPKPSSEQEKKGEKDTEPKETQNGTSEQSTVEPMDTSA